MQSSFVLIEEKIFREFLAPEWSRMPLPNGVSLDLCDVNLSLNQLTYFYAHYTSEKRDVLYCNLECESVTTEESIHSATKIAIQNER